MYTPPGMPRSRSFTRLTMRVDLLHLGQSVDFVVSISFLRSPVFAILAIGGVSPLGVGSAHACLAAGGFNGAVLRSRAELTLFCGRDFACRRAGLAALS